MMFVHEMARRMGLVLLVMGVSLLGAVVGQSTDAACGQFVGALVGLVIGGGAAWVVYRKRR